MMYKLVLQLKQGRCRDFAIDLFPVTIGSGEGSEIRLSHETLSASHTRLAKEGTRFFVTDLDSETGTLVNGERVSRAQLRPGDQLKVGAAVFRFEATSQGPEEIVLPQAGPEEIRPTQLPDAYKTAMRAPAQPQAAPAPATPRAPVTPGSIQVKSRILQYSHVEADEKRSVLKSDFSQFGSVQRALFLCALLVACAGIFWLCMWLAGN